MCLEVEFLLPQWKTLTGLEAVRARRNKWVCSRCVGSLRVKLLCVLFDNGSSCCL